MQPMSEGAEALIYATQLYGTDIVVKYRAPKRYRINELDRPLINMRTKKEAKLMFRASEAGVNVPRIIGIGDNVIYMERIKGDLFNDLEISAELARAAGKQLGLLHNSGIIHGDFTPANMMADGRRVYIIDFGLAESTSSSEERALDLLLMKRQISPVLYAHFAKSYSSTAKQSRETMLRLAKVERRGRYQLRTLA
jgi:TP53 regulating kinase-like protein